MLQKLILDVKMKSGLDSVREFDYFIKFLNVFMLMAKYFNPYILESLELILKREFVLITNSRQFSSTYHLKLVINI